ncbi:MAG: right-handed parallel beta-helix repeat-containing protein, partial [Candidatus Subteraquimicrobiales bacterium]|nr:right-handed parallel beta-helix repeat-containing protein [Candidatus Subteraquimicrobiales bacterium]
FTKTGTSGQNIKYDPGDFNPSSWDISNARIDIFLKPNYGNYLFNVSSIDGAANTITYVSNRGAGVDNRYYFQNIFQVLDVKNEWFYDKNTKMLYFYPGHTLTASDEISIPFTINTISVKGAKYIEFKGISVEETAGRHPYDKENYGNCVYIKNSENIILDGCKISNSETNGVFIGDSMNITVKNSEIFENGRGGVYMKDSVNYFKQLINTKYLITGNTFHDNGAVEIGSGEGGSGVLSTTVGSVISYNHVYNEPRIGIMLYAANDNIIEYNNVHDINLKTEDTGSIYTISENCAQRGHIIRNNYIKGSGGLGVSGGKIFTPNYSWGIYLDNGADGMRIQGNTIVDTYRGAVYVNGGGNNIIENNTFVENRTRQQILFGSRGDTTCWDFLQNFGSQGYNTSLYYQRYPELSKYKPNMTKTEFASTNQIVNNKFIYPTKDISLYAAGSLDLPSAKINNNTIWQGIKPINPGISTNSWNNWKGMGFDNLSV